MPMRGLGCPDSLVGHTTSRSKSAPGMSLLAAMAGGRMAEEVRPDEVPSLRLTPTEEGWFWMVAYESQKQRSGFASGPRNTLRLAVLMNGTVLEPTVTKQ